jgi:hypothetical protein
MEQGVLGIDILTTTMVGIRRMSRYMFRARILQKTTGRGQGVDEDYNVSVNGVLAVVSEGVGDKGIDNRARYLSTPEAR